MLYGKIHGEHFDSILTVKIIVLSENMFKENCVLFPLRFCVKPFTTSGTRNESNCH